MDRNSPDYYVEPSVSDSINTTLALFSHIHALPEPRLVKPVLTPRFAIACSDNLLSELRKIAVADTLLLIQTHISENRDEIRKTLKLFPWATSYADVYDKYTLLGPRTVLAHAVHLEEEEITLVKERNAGVSHCPKSNFNLRSGVCPVGKLLDRGIKVFISFSFYSIRLSITEYYILGHRYRSALVQMSRVVFLLPFLPRYSTPPLHRKLCRCRHPLGHCRNPYMKVTNFLLRRCCILLHLAERRFVVWRIS